MADIIKCIILCCYLTKALMSVTSIASKLFILWGSLRIVEETIIMKTKNNSRTISNGWYGLTNTPV